MSPNRHLNPHPLALALAGALAGLVPAGLSQAQVLPAGAAVVSGQANIVVKGNQMTVSNSANAVLNWQSFSIGAGQSVHFEQPNAASQVLNRVLGRDPSLIAGRLSSNGGVWLLNPYGVLFGPDAHIDVAGLVASTLNISDADWQARRFSLLGGNNPGAIDNQGEIRTTLGGRVLLLGGSAGVRNGGLIEAPGGQVVLAAGESIDLADSGSPNLGVRITAPAGAVLNLGRVLAPGGQIDLQAAMVNQQGIVRADSLSGGPAGEVRLSASTTLDLAAGSRTSAEGGQAADGGRITAQGGTALIAGALSTDAEQGRGGAIRLLGQNVGLLDGALVSASGGSGGGEVLAGGGLQGKDASVPNAQALYMAPGATVRADAGGHGGGGLIVLWSDHATRAYGTLSARGGALAGDGGFIETSGGWLDAQPKSVRTDAPLGRPGQWLLDPNNIVIDEGSSSNSNVSTGPNFQSSDDSAFINVNAIIAALEGGNNVSVTTGSGGANLQSGDITISGDLFVDLPSQVSLTLNAARHINVYNASIGIPSQSSSAPLDLTFNAGTAGTGTVTMSFSSIYTTGNVTLRGTGANISANILANSVRVAARSVSFELYSQIYAYGPGDAIVLAGDSGNIRTLNVQGSPLNTPNGRWLVYATDPRDSANFEPGGLSPAFKQYAATAGSTVVQGSGNGLLFSLAPQLQVVASLAGPTQKIYDGGTSTAATLVGGGISTSGAPAPVGVSGLLSDDQLATPPAFQALRYASASAGNGIPFQVSLVGGEPVVVDDSQRPVYGYRFNPTVPGAVGSIMPRPVTVGSLPSFDKVYDGSREVMVSGGAVTGTVAGEDLSFSAGTLAFDTADAGQGKAVTGVLALADGTTGRAVNYTLATGATISATGDIARRPVSVISASVADKVYDGTRAATFLGARFIGTVEGEHLTGQPTALAFETADAGTGKTVAGTLLLTDGVNGLARNYALTGDGAFVATADITPKPVNLTGGTVANKVYDGTRAATFQAATVTGTVAGENLTVLPGALTFDTADVGTGKAVTGTLSLADGPGGSARNYTLTGGGAISATANITPKPVTLTGATVADKVYDGTTTATISAGTLTGLVGTQTLTVAADGTRFDSKDAGTGKQVTGTLRVADGDNGGRAANYELTNATALVLSGNITPRPLSLSGTAVAADKAYDGNTLAGFSVGTLQGLLAGESLAIQVEGRFDNSQVGIAKNVFGQVALSDGPGGLASNYTFPGGGVSARASITPRPVTVQGVFAADKAYDGTTTAVLRAQSFQGLVLGETLNLATLASFDTKNVGTGKAVSGSVALADGSGRASNYLLTNPGAYAGTAAITPRGLTVAGAVAANKRYDGSPSASVSDFVLSGAITGEQVGVAAGSGQFADANVGTNKAVTATVNGLNGADAANYALLAPSVQVRASISPATLTYAADRIDAAIGHPLPLLTGNLIGLVAGDNQASATTGQLQFTTTASRLSPEGSYPVLGAGLSARNYVFAQDPGNETALTIIALSTTKLGEQTSATPTVPALVEALRPASVITSVAVHRSLDVLPGLQFAPASYSFRVLNLETTSQQDVASMLAARDRYKKAVFADAIRELELNPSAADVPACQTTEQAAAGNCLITEVIKPALRERTRIEGLTALATAAPAAPAAVAAPAAATTAPAFAPPPADVVTPPTAPAPAATAAPAPASASAPAPAAPPVLAALTPIRAPITRADAQVRLPAARPVRTASLPQIQRKWALLIGTDVYADNRIPQLDNAVADVDAVAQVLESKLGYQTLVVRNGSKAAIVRAFNQLAAAVDPSDSVAIYYAGHGELIEKIGLGFWQPSDADASKAETWISNTDIGKLLGQLGASQVVLVSDSCFSGSLVSDERIRAAGGTPDAAALLSRRAAVVMSSGGNEPVFDSGKNGHSTFAWSFMRALENVASWRPGSNVFEQVRFQVARQVPQRPQYGASRLGGHQSGADYVFEQRQLDALSK